MHCILNGEIYPPVPVSLTCNCPWDYLWSIYDFFCQAGAPFGACKNIGTSNPGNTPSINSRGGIYSGTIELSGSVSRILSSDSAMVKLLYTLPIIVLLL